MTDFGRGYFPVGILSSGRVFAKELATKIVAEIGYASTQTLYSSGVAAKTQILVSNTTDTYTESGHKCLLPFSYRGITFAQCTTFDAYPADDNRLWCAISENGAWDYCGIMAST